MMLSEKLKEYSLDNPTLRKYAREVAQLEAENARLREKSMDVYTDGVRLVKIELYEQLQADNARLREACPICECWREQASKGAE